MNFAPATKHTNGLRAITAAVSQLLLLIVLGYATTYIVRAVLNP
jgi:hypothetical protein